MNENTIITNYLTWIKDNTLIKNIEKGETFLVSTPFLDRNNDCIDIYVLKDGDRFKLSDLSYTIDNLRMSGFEINSPKREKAFDSILKGFGIKKGKNNEIYIEANESNIGERKHYIIQCILAVNDLFVLSQESIKSFFKEDLELFFKGNQIVYVKDIKLVGKAGFDNTIDFLLPSIQGSKEKYIKALNTPSKDNINSSIFTLNDISSIRDNSEPILIYNDFSETRISDTALTALQNYGISAIPFSQKETLRSSLYVSPYK